MKIEQTECSETSAYKIQTPGNYPEGSIQQNIFLKQTPTDISRISSFNCILVHSVVIKTKSNKIQQCINVPDNVHQLHVQQPSTYEKPEAASAVFGS